MTPFVVVREEDRTGVAGTGVVAEGVELGSGKAVLSWLSGPGSLAIYDSTEQLLADVNRTGRARIIYRPIRPERSLLSAFGASNGRPRPRVARHAR